MLQTPFGPLCVLADGEETAYQTAVHPFRSPLAGCWRVRVSGAGKRCIRVQLPGAECGVSSTGEDFLAVEFVRENTILTIGSRAEDPAFMVRPETDGMTVTLRDTVGEVVFGIAWAQDYAGDSDVRTWLAADPA